MTFVIGARRDRAANRVTLGQDPGHLDVQAIRRHFTFPQVGRVVTNNAASTQPQGNCWRCTSRSHPAQARPA